MIFTNKEIPTRTFTSTEISKMLNVPSGSLTTYKRKLNLNIKWQATNKGRECIWTYNDMLILKNYLKKQQEKKMKRKGIECKVPAVSKVMTIDEMRMKYPLVKDDRFFILDFFPDIVPFQFKDEQYN